MKTPLLASSIILLLTACGSAPDEDLTAANTALSQMASNRTLSRSCFTVAYPDGQAADFIDYMFSDLGSAEWPVAFDEYEEQAMGSIGQVPLPANVAVSPLSRTSPNQKELVLTANNAERKILVQGYLANDSKVVFEDEWPVGTAVADDMVREMCISNLEMGISPVP